MKEKRLCAACAARTVGELMGTDYRLVAADGKLAAGVCEGCGKARASVVRYEARRREPDGADS